MLHQEVPLPVIPRSAACYQRKCFPTEFGAEFVICELCLSFGTAIEPWKQLKTSIASTSKPRCLIITSAISGLDKYLLDPLGILWNAGNGFAHGHR